MSTFLARHLPAHRMAVRGIVRTTLALVLLAALAAGALLPAGEAPLLGAPRAGANGVPTIVSLTYLEGLSNWGPEQATGEVELVFAEGYVRLDADGLPLLDGERYQGWIVNSETNDAISVGQFNANVDGEVHYEGTLPPIADFGFDLFIITVEPEPDDAPQPTAQRSIGGRFSLIGLPASDGGISTDTATPGEGGAPAQLPNTGDPTLVTDVLRVSVLGIAIVASMVLAVRLSRRPAAEQEG